MKDRTLIVQAPAKLNLCLNITGRREDGYHLLDSLFVFCDLKDELSLSESSRLEMATAAGPFAHLAEADDNNLVLKAARLLQCEAGISRGARLVLHKNIPVAAGLGGGSADAAATLRGLNQFWGLHWSDARLAGLAARLGADIPACLQSQPVMARGIGDILSNAPTMPACGILLVNPLHPSPTPDVFRAYARAKPVVSSKPLAAMPGSFPTLATLTGWMALRGNDLVAAASSVQPAISDVLAALEALLGAATVGMSGSGATCFALFSSEAEAVRNLHLLQERYPHWWLWAGGWHQT